MFFHLEKLNEYRKGIDPSPILLEINLTNQCPLKCEWCISSYSHKKEKIDSAKLISFLWSYKKAGGKSVTWSGGGEPTSHPDFIKIIQETKVIGLDQGLMTNGVFPNSYCEPIAECLNWVRFSLDTSNPIVYCETKNTSTSNYYKVTKNIETITKSTEKIRCGVNMNLRYDSTFEEVDKLFVVSAEMGVDYFQVRPILPRSFKKEERLTGNDRLKIYNQMEQLKEIDGVHRLKTKCTISWDKYNDLLMPDFGRTYTSCRGHIFEAVIDANGDFDVCMYWLKNPDFVMGNIYSQTFPEIWLSKKRQKVKDRLTNFDFHRCQVCCKCHEINKLLAYIENPDKDVNFI